MGKALAEGAGPWRLRVRWQKPMVAVLVALLPCAASALYHFGWRALAVTAVVCAAALLAEWPFARNRRQPINSAVLVTAAILALSLPPTIPFWMAVIAGIMAVIVGRELWGGTARNLFNPALLGRLIIFLMFPVAMLQRWQAPALTGLGGLVRWTTEPLDAVTQATPLGLFRVDTFVTPYSQLVWGHHAGCLGETSALAVLLGGAYLFFRGMISWRPIIACVLGALGTNLLLHMLSVPRVPNPVWSVMTGGFLFATVFMITDPVTGCKTHTGKYLFGASIGVLTILLRRFGPYPEGVMFAVLFMNALAPAIDRLVRRNAPKPAAPVTGGHTITINGQRHVKVEGEQSLLFALMRNKIFIPSACGGQGACAYCKVKVGSGGGPVGPEEAPLLTAEERAAGFRIACQVPVRGDMAIEIPPELLGVQQYRAHVERITELTHDTQELRFRLIEPKTIAFRAGQYVQLQTPVYPGSKEPVYRAYSVSSPPRDNGAVEMIIRLVPNGICTTWVFKYLKTGDEVLMNGPYGDFLLRPTETEVIFVAGGTGFAPIKSMIQESPDELNRRGAQFFFGARTVRDLFHLKLMREISAQYPNIRFIPALSQPHPEEPWEGERGLITDVIDRRLPAVTNREFYLCGSPGMIDACAALLQRKGVAEGKIYYDKFT